MADQKISALTEVTAPAASDVVPIVNSSTTKKVQIQNLVKLGKVAIAARAFHSTTQSIPNNTSTALNFNSERFDTDVIHDNATNNERLTCKTAGLYLITANIGFAANATGVRAILLQLNGTTFIASINGPNNGASASRRLEVSTLYQLAVNDFVTVLAFQDSGGSLNTEQVANITPEFSMVRLGA